MIMEPSDPVILQLDLPFTDVEVSVPARFRWVAQQLSAEHSAVVTPRGVLSYRDLDEQSDQLAVWLLDLIGSRPQPVALLLPPYAVEVQIAALGVLKAGHFYVPLNPAMPDPGLQGILVDCPAPVVVTVAALRQQAERLLAGGRRRLVCLEDLPLGPAERDWPKIDPDANASIFYTSGSTGQPRGVVRTHQYITRSASLVWQELRHPTAEKIGHTLQYFNAMSNISLWGSLLNGSTMYSLSAHEVSPQAFYHWLEQHGITVLVASPGILRMLATLGKDRSPLPALHTIQTGGDVLRRREIEALFRLMPPGGQVVSKLASTEASTYAILHLKADTPWQGEHPPAGMLTESTEVLIVDENGQPLPVGQSGEIWVRNAFKMGGYWNQPELNAARLISSPTGEGEPFFKTGDFGRLTDDGRLEFLGRKDFLVKIRGYRIQLEEVEAALNALDPVEEAVVVAQPLPSGERCLAAYIVLVPQAQPTTGELRHLLAQRLPEFMIPPRYVFVDHPLPRTPSGKVDRQALPPPSRARPNLNTPLTIPRSALEQQAADLWAELLELDEVGIFDNFFELGGDSLSALHMILQVEEQFGASIPAEYFKEPTVAHLASLISPDHLSNPADSQPDASFTQPASKPNSWRGLVRARMIETGPLFDKIALPYRIGILLQRAWLASPLVRKKLFHPQIELMTRWAERVGEPNLDRAIWSSLLANTWYNWRNQVLSEPAQFSKWVTLTGDPSLWQSHPNRRGVVFLVTHNRLNRLFYQFLAANGRIPLVFKGVTEERIPDLMGMSQLFHQAYQALGRGELVSLAGDGFRGQHGVTLPFWGETRMFRYGGAELAVRTGALLVPLFCTITPHGHMTIEICSPLSPGSGSTSEQVERLTRAYAELLTARWPHVYATQLWEHMVRWAQKIAEGLI